MDSITEGVNTGRLRAAHSDVCLETERESNAIVISLP